ncbi:MAG: PAS domain-containing sensor histidine kinase [Ekhidna sp.]
MIFRKGFWFILVRVIVLVFLLAWLVYSYYNTELIVTPIMIGVLLLVAIIELNWYLQKQERNWVNFLQSIQYQDFNRSYQNQNLTKELAEAYKLITQSMEELQSSKQAEFRLLQTVLGHVSIAVVCFQDDGQIVFTNKAFDALLNLPGLINIDRLKREFPNIYEVLTSKDESLSEWIDHIDGQKLFAKVEVFKLQQRSHTLVSFTDIRSSLDAKELDSYQKLMRVMTHEIMNSATPVLSLIRVVNKKMISESGLTTLELQDQQNIATSLQAIEERTAGILKFVESYKKINKPIKPHLESVHSAELVQMINTLMKPSSNIVLEVKDDLNDDIVIDRTLISQVLINLIKNAEEAVSDIRNGKIEVTLRGYFDNVIIDVADNGAGVSSKDLHQIFVPFYTTKLDGSGIGLALSRKIIKAHSGVLEYTRVENKTRFTISIPS